HAAERVAPVGDGSIKMRMRHRDRLQPAERADILHRLVGCERNAIPHHATVRLAQQQRALADRKGRFKTDAGNIEIIAPDELAGAGQFLAGEPSLPLPVHKLPFVLADRTRTRWHLACGKLRTTLLAAPQGHAQTPISRRGGTADESPRDVDDIGAYSTGASSRQ